MGQPDYDRMNRIIEHESKPYVLTHYKQAKQRNETYASDQTIFTI